MSDGVWRREEKQWHFLVPWHVLQVLMLTWLSPSPLPAPSPGCCSLDFQPGLSPGPGGIGLGTLQTQQGNNIEIFQQATCSCVPPPSPDALERAHTPCRLPGLCVPPELPPPSSVPPFSFPPGHLCSPGVAALCSGDRCGKQQPRPQSHFLYLNRVCLGGETNGPLVQLSSG